MSADRLKGSLGLDPRLVFYGIFYNHCTRSIVVHHYERDHVGRRLIHVRKANELSYRRMAPAGENVSYEEVLVPSDAPFLYANLVDLGIDQPDVNGEAWNSLVSIDLESDELKPVVRTDDLPVPTPYDDGWVAKLISTTDKGSLVTCVVGMLRPATDVDRQGHGQPSNIRSCDLGQTVDYWICHIHASTKELLPLCQLVRPFV